MLLWKYLILVCLVILVKCKRDNHIKRVAGKAMSKRHFIQLCCGVKPCKNSTTPRLVKNATASWTQTPKPNTKILTAESIKKTSTTTQQAKKKIKATTSPLVSSVSTQKTESTTSKTVPETSSSTTETSLMDPDASPEKLFPTYEFYEEVTTPPCLPPQCTTQLTSPLPLPSCPSKCEPNNYLVNLAQKMHESMEGLEVDLFSSPGTPTFFKACNRTYFLVSKMLTWEEAYVECCSYGSQPVSLESKQELKCVLDMYYVHLYSSQEQDMYEFWTSATNRGLLGADARYPAWCASKTSVHHIKIAERGDFEYPSKRRGEYKPEVNNYYFLDVYEQKYRQHSGLFNDNEVGQRKVVCERYIIPSD